MACELGRALVVVGWPSVDGGTIVPSQHLTTARSISSHYKPRKALHFHFLINNLYVGHNKGKRKGKHVPNKIIIRN